MRKDAITRCTGLQVLLLLGLAVTASRAEENSPPDAKAVMKSVGLDIDIKKREVRMDATVCLNRGILEYLVCLPGTFEHESVFTTKSTPSLLHLTLLTVGLEPCEFDASGDWEKKASEQTQSRVCIEVEYDLDGKKVRRNVRDFLMTRQEKEIETPVEWVFTGSYFGDLDGKRVYAADSTGGVIGLGLEGASVLQFGKVTGNPYKGREAGLKINPDTVPAKGTKVQIIFTPCLEKCRQAEAVSSADTVKP